MADQKSPRIDEQRHAADEATERLLSENAQENADKDREKMRAYQEAAAERDQNEMKKSGERAEKSDSVLSYMDRASVAIGTLAKTNLGWLSLLVNVVAVPLNIFKIIHAAALDRSDKQTRGMKIIMAAGGVALGVISAVAAAGAMVIAAPVLIITSAAKALFESLWDLGKRVVKYTFGKGKTLRDQVAEDKKNFYDLAKNESNLNALRNHRENKIGSSALLTAEQTRIIELDKQLTEGTNKQNRQQSKMGRAAHVAIQCAVGLVGAALLFTPAAPVGIILLVATAAYGIADAVGLNPLKRIGQGLNWLSKKLFNKDWNPFAEKEHHESIENIEKNVAQAKPAATETVKTKAELYKGIDNTSAKEPLLPKEAAPQIKRSEAMVFRELGASNGQAATKIAASAEHALSEENVEVKIPPTATPTTPVEEDTEREGESEHPDDSEGEGEQPGHGPSSSV